MRAPPGARGRAAVLFCAWLALPGVGGNAQTEQAVDALREFRGEIAGAALAFHQDPRALASIVFAERSSNVRFGEAMAETLAARCGYNCSLGVAQLKVQTARWIEQRMMDDAFGTSVSEATKRALAPSRTRSELIDRLERPSTNLMYAAAYVALIAALWDDVLDDSTVKNVRVGVIATLYSLGLVRADGSLRTPHADPAMNRFGELAQSFYDGALLREEFPAAP